MSWSAGQQFIERAVSYIGRTVERSFYHVVQEGFTEFECATLCESIPAHLGQGYEYYREQGSSGQANTHPVNVLVIEPRGPSEPGDEDAIRAAVRNAARNFGTVSAEAEITLLRMPNRVVLEHLCRVADVTGFADCDSDE